MLVSSAWDICRRVHEIHPTHASLHVDWNGESNDEFVWQCLDLGMYSANFVTHALCSILDQKCYKIWNNVSCVWQVLASLFFCAFSFLSASYVNKWKNRYIDILYEL